MTDATPTLARSKAIACFKLGCHGWHGLTVFGKAVRVLNRHGHVEDSRTWYTIPNLKQAMALQPDVSAMVESPPSR
ncbi:MAG: hypothetical protein JSS49_11115 [Planctomycetes bacterium]|nr:hypothetical protein [Planctomycetota bacterium]